MPTPLRLLKRKRVTVFSKNQDGSSDSMSYVDIPVIAEMTIIGTNAQEFRYRFVNDSRTQLRTVKVKKVGNIHGAFGNEVNFDNYVNAERIQSMAFTGTVEQISGAWRTDKKFKNQDPAPKQPDGSDDPRHLKVHYVRYYQNNNVGDNTGSGTWIDVEMIDQMDMLGTNAQEYGFKLKNPTSDDYAEAGGGSFGQTVTDDDPYEPVVGFCDPSLELLDRENDEDGNPLPARLDPFQNIVNCSGRRVSQPRLMGNMSIQAGFQSAILLQGLFSPSTTIQAPSLDLNTYTLFCGDVLQLDAFAFYSVIDPNPPHALTTFNFPGFPKLKIVSIESDLNAGAPLYWYPDAAGTTGFFEGSGSGLTIQATFHYGQLGPIIGIEVPHEGGGPDDLFIVATVTPAGSLTYSIDAGQFTRTDPAYPGVIFKVAEIDWNIPGSGAAINAVMLFTPNGEPPR